MEGELRYIRMFIYIYIYVPYMCIACICISMDAPLVPSQETSTVCSWLSLFEGFFFVTLV